jgi:hypothetical protein
MPVVQLSGSRLKKSVLDLLETLGFRPRELESGRGAGSIAEDAATTGEGAAAAAGKLA